MHGKTDVKWGNEAILNRISQNSDHDIRKLFLLRYNLNAACRSIGVEVAFQKSKGVDGGYVVSVSYGKEKVAKEIELNSVTSRNIRVHYYPMCTKILKPQYAVFLFADRFINLFKPI